MVSRFMVTSSWSLGVGECDTSLQAAETAGARGRSLFLPCFGRGVLVQRLLYWVSLSLEGGGNGDCFVCLFSDFLYLCGTGGVLRGGWGAWASTVSWGAVGLDSVGPEPLSPFACFSPDGGSS